MSHETPKKPSAAPTEEVKIIEGKEYRRVDSGYTLRQYFSHSTPEKGPGPGWDTRMRLLEDDYALRKFGRTFSDLEVFKPENLPDEPYYEWKMVE